MPPLNLKEFVTQPEAQWFRFAEGLAGVDVMTDEDDPEDEVFRLQLKFLNQRQLRKMAGEGLSKKAITKGGGKALVASDDEYRKRIVLEVLQDWQMTVAGAYALGAECNFGDLDPATPIDFTQINVETLCEHSQLAAVVQGVLNDHEQWFSLKREDELGNSDGGPSSSTDGSRASSASTDD